MPETNPDKKNKILDAAEILFARAGFDGTSVREIAEKADVNSAMISYYFGSKEQLLYGIIDRFSTDVLEIVRKATASKVPADQKVRDILISYIRYGFRHPAPIVIARRELGVSSRPTLQEHVNCVYQDVRDMVIQVVQEGVSEGLFGDVDVPLFIFNVGGMMDNAIGEIYSLQLSGQSPEMYGLSTLDNPEFLQRFEQFYWELIQSYLLKK